MGDGTYGDMYEIGRELGLSPADVRYAVFQMRQRFRRFLEEEIRDAAGEEADGKTEQAGFKPIWSTDTGSLHATATVSDLSPLAGKAFYHFVAETAEP